MLEAGRLCSRQPSQQLKCEAHLLGEPHEITTRIYFNTSNKMSKKQLILFL